MPEEKDFEQAWLLKFSDALDEIAGEEIRKKVMHGVGTGRDLSHHHNQRKPK